MLKGRVINARRATRMRHIAAKGHQHLLITSHRQDFKQDDRNSQSGWHKI
jgi:hypothetical protein